MKITITSYEKTYSLDTGKEDLSFNEFMTNVKNLSKSLYSSKNVDEYFNQ